MTGLVETSGLTVWLGGNLVLDRVDFAIHWGEIVTIVGPNGSGKSTLLRALIGSIRPDRGRISRAPGLRLGYVPQRLALDPTLPMTVARFLALTRRVARHDRDAALARAGIPDLGG